MQQLQQLFEGCVNLLKIISTTIIPAISDMKSALCAAFPPYIIVIVVPILVSAIVFAKKHFNSYRL